MNSPLRHMQPLETPGEGAGIGPSQGSAAHAEVPQEIGLMSAAARLNRELLQRAGVLAVSVVGGPGCGKSSLIDTTIDWIVPDVCVLGVVACDSATGADMRSRYAQRIVRMPAGDDGGADAARLGEALRKFDLRRPGVLFVEDDAPPTYEPRRDLGQSATAVVFSVAGGHRMAMTRPDLIRAADAVILNKIDLLPSVPFDVAAFKSDVRRMNPRAVVFELSAQNGRGVPDWIDWLRSLAAVPGQSARAVHGQRGTPPHRNANGGHS